MTFALPMRAPVLLLAAWLAVACSGGGAADDAVADGKPDAAPADTALDAADTARDSAESSSDVPTVADTADATEAVPPDATPDAAEPAPDAIVEVEKTPEIVEGLDIVAPDGGDADTALPPMVSACVDCHTDKPRLVALLPEEPTEEADHGGG